MENKSARLCTAKKGAKPYVLATLGVLIAVVLCMFIYRMASAALVPSVSFHNIDNTPMIGEQTAFTLRFDNTGDQAGFGPYVDLVLPEDFSNPSASYLGQSVNVQPIGPFPA